MLKRLKEKEKSKISTQKMMMNHSQYILVTNNVRSCFSSSFLITRQLLEEKEYNKQRQYIIFKEIFSVTFAQFPDINER